MTGATQGLGFALAEGLARQLAPGDVVYLTGRDPDRVRKAVERVDRPRVELRGHVLDVRDGASVAAFADAIRARHLGVDIVFSNAAARLTPGTPAAELVEPFVDTNNLGTTRMLRAFDQIVRPGGRMLVVASSFGSLRELPTRLRGVFDTDAMTLDDVDAVMLAWRDAVVEGRAAEEGWPDWINIPSKVGQVAAVRVLARERRTADAGDGSLVAAVCPGAYRHCGIAAVVRRHEHGSDARGGRCGPSEPRPRPGGAAPLRGARSVRGDRSLAVNARMRVLRLECCRGAAGARGRQARPFCVATPRPGTDRRSGPSDGRAGNRRRRNRVGPWSRRSHPR